MADALTERCWVCTKLCDAERGCLVAPEAYAGHDVLACSDNHFNRAYEMAMGIKPANRTFYDFARVAERRDEGRGKDYGFRVQEIVFEPNFPPYRRDELSKSLRAESLSDKEYRQLLKEIMLSTQSKGEFEWAVSEIRKLNQKGAETFEAQMPFEGAVEQMDRHYSEMGKKANKSDIYAKLVAHNGIEKMGQIKKAIEAFYNTKLEAETFEADDDSKLRQQAIETIEARVADYSSHEDVSPYWGDGIANPNKYLYFKLRYAWNNHPDMREIIIEQYVRGIKDGSIDPANPLENSEAETFEADCRDCYGTGGLYDSRLGIDDECASCGGTGESFEADGGIQVAEGYNEWWDELDAIRNEYPPNKFFNRRLGNPKWEDVILEQLYKDGWTPRQALYTWKFYTGQAFAFKAKPDERKMELYEYKLKPQKCGNCGGIGHNRRSCSATRNDPDFDPEKADRNKDGEISDWERAVGNAVAKGIREHKDRKEAETFEAEQIQYDVMKGKFAKGYEYANYISLHDSFEEAEAVAKRERKKLEKDEAIFIVEESFDDETFEIDTTLLKSISKSPMIKSFPDASKDSFGAESVSDLELQKDSCCCGATKKTPCVCMILGRDCSAKKPMCACYRLKAIQQKDEKGAETFEAEKRDGRDMTLDEIEETYGDGRLCFLCFEGVMERGEMGFGRDATGTIYTCSNCGAREGMGLSAETFEAKGDDKYYINNRPQWMPKLMKGSVEVEDGEAYNRHDKGYVAGLFLKSSNDDRLNGILKQTNYQDSDIVGFIMPFDLITRKLAKDYEPLILKDNFGKSNKYLVINGTPYNYDVFNSMLMRLPPTTEVRISGKPKYPLMFEFKFLNENYLMFLAPVVGDDFDASQHGDYAKEVMSKSGAGFGFKKPPKAKKISKEEAEKAFNQRRDKIRKRMFYPKGGVGLYSPAKERFEKAIDGREAKTDFNDASEWNPLLEKALPLMTDAEMEDYVLISTKRNKEDKPLTTAFFEMIVEERGEGNDPDFDPEKADRNKDGEISDWERAVGNAVAKGIREHKERKEAESFGAWDVNCSLCNGTGWMPKKGDPKKDAKLAKLLGLSIDELTLTPCKAGGKSMGCWSANNSSRLRRLQRAESRPVSYMVKSDAHKLTEASKRIHDKADKNREYPEWWKSKLSVVRNDADKLSDFLDYAVVEGVFESEGDHDHEEIDELIDKLNTVVDFAITFVHDGGYGGEPKGILVDEDLGIKTEVVHYIEGSIQLNLVRDIDTNELLSVRFSLTGDPDQTPIVYLPLPEEITTVPEDDRVSAKN